MKSEESFKKWCDNKIKINSRNNSFQPKNWEFRTYTVWVNIWWEMSVSEPFIRPCMILNVNMLWDLIFVVPVSTQYWDWAIKQKYYQEIGDYIKYWLVEKSYFLKSHNYSSKINPLKAFPEHILTNS